MKEEWRNIIIAGKVCPWYSVSNYGNVTTHIKKEMVRVAENRLSGCKSTYYPSYKKIKTLSVKKHNNNTPKYVFVKLGFPLDFFDDTHLADFIKSSYARSEYKQKRKTLERELKVHQLVMSTFKPLELFPPIQLKECWSSIPEPAKQWVKDTVCINHIDHNPCNNNVLNLEYTTTIDNSYKAIQFYSGSYNNKRKFVNG